MAHTLLLAVVFAAAPAFTAPLRVRIATDDGMPLPEATTAAVICDEKTAVRGTVDIEGWALLEMDLQGGMCEMRVTAPDYEEGAVAISDLPMDSRIPAIALRRRARHRGESMSTSHLSAPDAAVASFHAAMRAMADPSGVALAEVLKHLNAATEAYPGFAQAWYETGRVHLAAGNPRQAAVALKRSVEVDTWFVSPYEPLILSLRAIGLDAEAAAACAGLRRINPAIPPGCPSGRTQ